MNITASPTPWTFQTNSFANHAVLIPAVTGWDPINPQTARKIHLGYTAEAEANARLITAAPELLAALKESRRIIEHLSKCNLAMDFGHILNLSRNAIDKAEGRA